MSPTTISSWKNPHNNIGHALQPTEEICTRISEVSELQGKQIVTGNTSDLKSQFKIYGFCFPPHNLFNTKRGSIPKPAGLQQGFRNLHIGSDKTKSKTKIFGVDNPLNREVDASGFYRTNTGTHSLT